MKEHRLLTPSQEARAERSFFDAICSLRDVGECENFLKDLCTPAELQAMVDRWNVAEQLMRDIPYRKIHEATGVSVTTIGRVARFLSQGHGGYQAVLKRLRS